MYSSFQRCCQRFAYWLYSAVGLSSRNAFSTASGGTLPVASISVLGVQPALAHERR